LAALTASIGLLVTYPVLSAYRYTEAYGPAHWQGLDGAAYIGETSPDELAALRWLSTHASAADVILEAQSCAYQPWGAIPTARVSAFTGVPTVLGWANHEGQWRAAQPKFMAQMRARDAAIADIYANPSTSLVQTYGITLLYVGLYEREGVGRTCPTAGLERADPSVAVTCGSGAHSNSQKWTHFLVGYFHRIKYAHRDVIVPRAFLDKFEARVAGGLWVKHIALANRLKLTMLAINEN
jgi:hypothetical protein